MIVHPVLFFIMLARLVYMCVSLVVWLCGR